MAKRLLLEVAKHGHPNAAFLVGKTLSDFKWIKKAANLGNADAMFEMAKYHQPLTLEEKLWNEIFGDTAREHDEKLSMPWLVKAADSGHGQAILWLTNRVSQSLSALPVSNIEKFKWVCVACLRDDLSKKATIKFLQLKNNMSEKSINKALELTSDFINKYNLETAA